MSKQRKPRGVCASPEGKKLLEEAKMELDSEGKRRTFESIAEKAQVNDKTVRRFFDGKNIDKSCAKSIIKALDLNWDSVIPLEEEKVEEAKEAINEIAEQHESNSNRAIELLKGLEKTLKEYREKPDIDSQAIDWLQLNEQALAEEAAEVVLREYYNQNDLDRNTECSKMFEQLSEDIKQYLYIYSLLLQEATRTVIDIAIQESSIPLNLDSELYVKALTVIK
ncbi:MAG: hypothetical protein AAF208_14915, partial [Cyanobacteria bacterium P01_A01_bin.45]